MKWYLIVGLIYISLMDTWKLALIFLSFVPCSPILWVYLLSISLVLSFILIPIALFLHYSWLKCPPNSFLWYQFLGRLQSIFHTTIKMNFLKCRCDHATSLLKTFQSIPIAFQIESLFEPWLFYKIYSYHSFPHHPILLWTHVHSTHILCTHPDL